MSDYNSPDANPTITGRAGAQVDQGLRSYMLGVYNYMTVALLVTAAFAYGTFSLSFASFPDGSLGVTEFGNAIYNTPLKWVIMLAPLAFILVMSFGINKLSSGATQILFWTFAAVMGVSISSIFAVFAGGSIVQVFLITSIAFAGLSLYGYTTKRDLSPVGSFMIMGLIGIIVASLVNLFLQSDALQFAVSVIGVVVFAGLTAYDTQAIKSDYYANYDEETGKKVAIHGALRLYLDFINMFLLLLNLLGNRE